MQYKIKEIREKKGISQSRLAELSGVSRATIIALENNEEHEAMVGTLKSLAEALGVPVSKLFA
ncbi:MAG: helix-turn-helix transcriptional regulator [Bacteroidales bacterium]|nr:helix-turn-helix transcriptional regulator [Candidatus Scybalousia scybalohippi]